MAQTRSGIQIYEGNLEDFRFNDLPLQRIGDRELIKLCRDASGYRPRALYYFIHIYAADSPHRVRHFFITLFGPLREDLGPRDNCLAAHSFNVTGAFSRGFTGLMDEGARLTPIDTPDFFGSNLKGGIDLGLILQAADEAARNGTGGQRVLENVVVKICENKAREDELLLD